MTKRNEICIRTVLSSVCMHFNSLSNMKVCREPSGGRSLKALRLILAAKNRDTHK